MMFPHWNWSLFGVSAAFHSVAVITTVFRFWYRWYTSHLGWDDAWALPAFMCGLTTFVSTLLEQPRPSTKPRFYVIGSWMLSLAYPILMWTARISILVSIVRVSRPEGPLRRIAISIGMLFGALGLLMLSMRINDCIREQCVVTKHLLATQTTSKHSTFVATSLAFLFTRLLATADCVADVLLSALPIWFLRKVKLSRKRRILVCSALSASMVINIVTVTQAVALYQSITSGSIIFEHVKLACAMMVCNLLVIVTFFYRMLHRDEMDSTDPSPFTSKVEFTTVLVLDGFCQDESKATTLSRFTTNSSAWSFRDDSQSKTPTTVAATVSLVRDEER